ncbi:MAG: hypothetical protein Hyperionvirus27_10 [Hyperionvirus sp.]|uniref:Uncharacterized protein n=1 Tax=Hyperionvirus sp. TaxID=2487770 RepID=A0A3G5ABB6_9VIRU|nr:MAG: hypothetical protein Hyperionvirus27_10 [Hyperionvirus sp.]
MNCGWHVTAFICAVVLYLIVGATTGARNAYFQPVKCVIFKDCPNNPTAYGDGDQCMVIKYNGGLEIIAVMENSAPRGIVPSECWSNGHYVSTYDPYAVMVWSLIAVTIIVGFYVIFSIKSFCSWDEGQNYKAPEQKNCAVCTIVTYMIIFTGVFFIAMFVTLGTYDLPYREVVCTGYALTPFGTSDPPAFANSVTWNDTNGNQGTYQLVVASNQPAVLPQPCWIDTDTATFYDPQSIYVWMSIIYGTLMLISILFWLGIYLCSIDCSVINQSPPPPVEIQQNQSTRSISVEMGEVITFRG